MEIIVTATIMVGVLHALAPDHWLPFVMLGKAQQWSRWKTTNVVLLAGMGHISSSIIIAIVGLAFGVAVQSVDAWDRMRGDLASLLLIGFGIAYAVWGVKHWGRQHSHHRHAAKSVSYWTLFAIIVFGPCEPLIPLIFASVTFGWVSVALIFLVFGISTITTMLIQVHLFLYGFSFARSEWFDKAGHVIAGTVIAMTGIIIRMTGM